MYYIIGFIGKKIDENRIRNLIRSLHKEDYKRPDINLPVNITFLNETILDESMSNQLRCLNSNINIEYKNKDTILLDIYTNKIAEYTSTNLNNITYIIINDISNKEVLGLIRKYTFHKIFYISDNKKPITNTDYYTYKFINGVIKLFYGKVFLEHLYNTNDVWISNKKGEYDFKLTDTLAAIRKTLHNTIIDYKNINKHLGIGKR